MHLVLITASLLINQALGTAEGHWDQQSCRMELYGHYFAKGCEPRGEGACPKYFSCPKPEYDSTKCYYNGEAYNVSVWVPVNEPCSKGCLCREGYKPEDRSQIICAIVECPSIFKIPDPACRRLYRPGDCCPYDEVCVREGETSTPDPITCTANNRTYEKGSRIYFKDFPCQTCVCDEKYEGPYGPGCRTLTCGFGFRYQRELARGCIPVYFKGRCCPIEWICTENNSEPVGSPSPSEQKEDNLCYLGGYKVELGETLYMSRCTVVCGCLTPPDVTCVQYPTCEEANKSSLFPASIPDERRRLLQ